MWRGRFVSAKPIRSGAWLLDGPDGFQHGFEIGLRLTKERAEILAIDHGRRQRVGRDVFRPFRGVDHLLHRADPPLLCRLGHIRRQDQAAGAVGDQQVDAVALVTDETNRWFVDGKRKNKGTRCDCTPCSRGGSFN